MIEFKDFFYTGEEKIPFHSGMEETRAYMRWLDMLLLSYEAISNQEEAYEAEEENLEKMKELLSKGLAVLEQRHRLTVGKQMEEVKGIGVTNLAAHLGLRDYSFLVFLLVLAPQLEERYLLIYQQLYEKEETITGVTFALVNRLYELVRKEQGEDDGEMFRQQIESNPAFIIYQQQMSDSGRLDRITLHPSIVALCNGETGLSEAERRVCEEGDDRLLHSPAIGLGQQTEQLTNLLLKENRGGDKILVHVTGKPGSGKKYLIQQAWQSDRILFINLENLFRQGGEESGRLLKSLLIRCKCLDLLPVFTNVSLKENTEEIRMMVDHAFDFTDLLLLTSTDTYNMNRLTGDFSYLHIAMPEYKAKEREALWKYYLRDKRIAEDVRVEILAGLYRFTPGSIINCIRQAVLLSASENCEYVERKHFQQVVHHFNSSKLAELATPITPFFTWEDLEISEEQRNIMKLACARATLTGIVDEEWGFEKKVRYGKGMSILLYGPPGTGKTMAAQVIAGEIGMEMYRVDLSQMVDKYIGETQKNIGRVFDCAKEGNFILFFDEADALFTKRTEVQNSNDKHANTEVNYLLQKMEEYDGICILSTNRYDNFDTAFIRRITYTVYLQKPDIEARERLYKSILPVQAKVEESLDFAFFARQFELNGSQIKAVLYNAAFMAANEGRGMKNQDIARAIKYEFSKLGKMIMVTEFEKYAPYV